MKKLYLIKAEDGKYTYEKENGDTFISKKRLESTNNTRIIENLEPAVLNVVPTQKEIDDITTEQIAQKFGGDFKDMNKDSGKALQDVFKNAMGDIVDKNLTEDQVTEQTIKLIAKLRQAGILYTVEHSKKVQKQVMASAEENIYSEIDISKQRQDVRVQDATYNANKFAANIYGIDSGRPKWQLSMVKAGANVFFIVWFIISTFTFTPIMFFLTMISVQVKSSGLRWFFTIILYLLLLFLLYLLVAAILGPEVITWFPYGD